MRSFAELRFRLGQELWNFSALLRPPRRASLDTHPLPLPDAQAVAAALRGTAWAGALLETAEQVCQGRLPVLGYTLELTSPPRWRLDPVHQIETPPVYFRRVPYLDFRRVGDHKIIWEINRHQYWVLLAQASLLSGEPRYRDLIEQQFASWAAANPFHRGINWASALEVGFRALSWLWVHHLVGEEFDAAFRKQFLTLLYQHGAHLAHNLSYYFSPNTHLLGEAVALHALGLLFGEDHWRQVGRRTVAAQMEHQVKEDGSHFEQSSYYHLYALDMFLFHHVMEAGGERYRQRLYRMLEYLHALVAPCGLLPMMGDEDGGRLFHPYGLRAGFAAATLATGALMFQQPAWAPADEAVYAEQACWYLGPQATPPVRPASASPLASRLFTDAGIGIMRSGDLAVIVDAGPMGEGSGGHSHADALQLLARRGGQELLLDAGTFTYVSDPAAREWFRSPAAHNTVRVDSLNQGVPAGPFRWSVKPEVSILQWASNTRHDYLHARCAYEGVRHERRVLLIKDLLLVVILDEVRHPAAGERWIEQFWHPGEATLAGDSSQWWIGAGAYLVFPSDETPVCETGGTNGWRSPVFGKREPAPVLRRALDAPLPARLWTVLDCSASPGVRMLRPARKEFELIASYDLPGRRVTVHFDCQGLPVHYQVAAA